MSQYPRIDADKPSKCIPCKCSRCGGSGVFARWGTCFRCGGHGTDPSFRQMGYPAAWSDEQCAAFDAKKQVAADAREEKARQKRLADRAAVLAANVAAVPALAAAVEGSMVVDSKLPKDLRDLPRELCLDANRRVWSEKQVAVVARGFEQAANFAAKKAVELASAVAVPAGKQEIEGEIVSLKTYQDDVYGTSVKMLVKVSTPAGSFKVFGSVPSKIADAALPGARVKFVADCQPKELGFGFFKRPTKAAVI